MIPSSYFIHMIQAERERDLERWQRVREARARLLVRRSSPGGSHDSWLPSIRGAGPVGPQP